MKHKTVDCCISVDEGIAPIVQFILYNYMYSMVPYGSCEDNKGKAQISLMFRFKSEVECLVKDLSLKDDPIIVEYNNDYLCTISWDSILNPVIYDRAIEFLDGKRESCSEA
jgi:hypothetical protein